MLLLSLQAEEAILIADEPRANATAPLTDPSGARALSRRRERQVFGQLDLSTSGRAQNAVESAWKSLTTRSSVSLECVFAFSSSATCPSSRLRWS